MKRIGQISIATCHQRPFLENCCSLAAVVSCSLHTGSMAFSMHNPLI